MGCDLVVACWQAQRNAMLADPIGAIVACVVMSALPRILLTSNWINGRAANRDPPRSAYRLLVHFATPGDASQTPSTYSHLRYALSDIPSRPWLHAGAGNLLGSRLDALTSVGRIWVQIPFHLQGAQGVTGICLVAEAIAVAGSCLPVHPAKIVEKPGTTCVDRYPQRAVVDFR